MEEVKLSEYNPDEYYYIVSVDIGIINLGISLISVNTDFTFREIIWFELYDITQFHHLNEESKKMCELYHEKTFCDYLEHIFYMNHELFTTSMYILIERQPPMGLVAIEQLIFSKYRNKAILISPNSMHAWMGWNTLKLNYEQRKVYSSKFALKYLNKSNRYYLVKEFTNMTRSHDVADAICMTIFFIHKKHLEFIEKQKTLKLQNDIEYAKKNGFYHPHLMLDLFKYNINKQ